MTMLYDATRAPVEWRTAETLEVRHPDRLITVLAMPYERPTHRVVHNGRQITEVVSKGAFAGIEHRRGVKVLRDHDPHRPTGRVKTLFPDRSDGLVAELYISRTLLGDETLELAADGVVGASVGFAPMAKGTRWSENRQERRLDKCFLDHIALVTDPAYDDAEVLDVRSAAEAEVDAEVVSTTPNLDRMRALLVEAGIQLRR